MSAIDSYKKKNNRYGVLLDLIAEKSKNVNESIFYSYKDKSEIGKEIFKELYLRFDSEGEHKGFYMDDTKSIGILSQCQSLQALLLLASDFDLSFDDKHMISEDAENYTIREIMDFVIEDIIRRVAAKRNSSKDDVLNNLDKINSFVFDASPYDTGKHFTEEYSNIEAITWVVPCFLATLQYHASIGETCKWQEILVKIIIYCLNYLNDSFISSPNETSSNKLEIGWNFTKGCEEPSLYYTFTVCECYVDFFETFRDYLEFKGAERNQKNGLIATIPQKLSGLHTKHEKDYLEALAKGDQGYNANGKKKAQFDEYNELMLRYREINGLDAIDETPYGELEEKCLRVAREIWRLTKGQLSDKFFYNDLATTLSEEDIAMATTSDALFNTVYIINIMLDAGLDEEFDLLRNRPVKSEQDLKKDEQDPKKNDMDPMIADQEYNNLFDACQLASQKAIRAYEKLKEQGKDYIVDQFLVGFNETFKNHLEKVKELRKLRMRVFSLMPLLIHTNNVISAYLIKYPQINMRKYLGYILENRYEEKNKFKWIWENDGFFSCSNYYYVAALGEFYRYYDAYEKKYIAIEEKNDTAYSQFVDKYEKELNGPGGKITSYKQKIEDKDREISNLREELANVEKPIEDAVAKVAEDQMKLLLPELLCNFISDAANGIYQGVLSGNPCDQSYVQLTNALKALMLAMISPNILAEIPRARLTKQETLQQFERLEFLVKKETKRCLGSYIAEIKNSTDKKSTFYNQN